MAPVRELNFAELSRLLREALPLLARAMGGKAVITDTEGHCLHAVQADGEATDPSGAMVDLCRRAAAEGRPLTLRSDDEPWAEGWAVPLGGLVLAGNNRHRVDRSRDLFNALKDALPLIAQVADGEAVLFSRDGRRLYNVFPDGSMNDQIGQPTERFRQAMASYRPLITPSASAPGAMAVRIPITPDFGFGFNNAWTVAKKQLLLQEVKKHQSSRYGWGDIVGDSPATQAALQLARRAAKSASPVLLYGETGTGKELFAQAIHTGSPRRFRPFVAINCAALPASLIESQLFGYEEGAFTGARRGGQPGLFEEANGGTLLLDEISEMDLVLQAKLLRVLQEKEVRRIGGSTSTKVDVRIIATTNLDLATQVRQGKFRQDLYYRLHVVDIRIPPLRERKGDIPALARHFLQKCAVSVGWQVADICSDAMAMLCRHLWPGNVRELQNCIERALNLADGDEIMAQHLPAEFALPPAPAAALPVADLAAAGEGQPQKLSLEEIVRNAERTAVENALRATAGNRTRAAEMLGISVSTLWRKMRDLGIEGEAGA